MAGYIRQSAASIISGNEITAAPLNNEFNALQASFHATTGHAHDGSLGNGPKINLTTSISGVLPVANGGFGAIHNLSAIVDPTVNDDSVDGYGVGSIWINTDDYEVWICVDATATAAVWEKMQPYSDTLAGLDSIDNNPGFIAQLSADVFGQRTITGTANQITVTNGNGVSGNPVISLPSSVTISGTMSAGSFSGTSATLTGALSSGSLSTGTGAFTSTVTAQKFISNGTLGASNQVADLQQGYGLYSDNTGTIGTTRFWIDGPDNGEIHLGPRGGSEKLANVRVLSNQFQVQSDTAISTFNSVGDLSLAGGLTATTGTFSSTVTMPSTSKVKGSGSGVGTSYLRFDDSAGIRMGWVGVGSTSNADLSLFADSGNVRLTAPVGSQVILTASSGVALGSSPLTTTGNVSTGQLTATNTIIVNGAAATDRTVNFTTSSSVRFSFGLNAVAESGTATGSDFAIHRFNNSGTYLGSPITITRLNGNVVFEAAAVATNTAKAWVNFAGSTAAIRDSYNVSSITDGGVGIYTVNFSTAMANADYVTIGTCNNTSGAKDFTATTATTTNVIVNVFKNDSTYTDADYIGVVVFGD